MMKQPGNPQWHRRRNKSTLALELARLRLQVNRWLESGNGANVKETKFRRPAKQSKNKHVSSEKHRSSGQDKSNHRNHSAF